MGYFGLDILGALIQPKPKVPEYQTYDLGQEQIKATNANLAALPGLETLASRTNTFNLAELTKMLKAAIPGYEDITKKSSDAIQSELRGEVPRDVQDQLQRSAAAQSIGGGFAGSGFGRNLFARDLGLSSLNLIQTGLDTSQRWLTTMKNLATPGQFDFSSMFITPMQQFAADSSNAQSQFQRNWLQEQIDIAHAPGTIVGNSLINTEASLDSLANSVVGSYLGGGMGGMGGGGGGGGSSTPPPYNPNKGFNGGFNASF